MTGEERDHVVPIIDEENNNVKTSANKSFNDLTVRSVTFGVCGDVQYAWPVKEFSSDVQEPKRLPREDTEMNQHMT